MSRRTKASSPTPIDAEIEEAIRHLRLDLTPEEHDELVKALREVVSDSGAEAIGQIGLGRNEDDIFRQVNERAAKWAEHNAADLVSQVSKTTRREIHDEIARGLEEGLTKDEIADNVQELTSFSDYRSELIARTEVANANSAGALEGYKSARDTAGVRVLKEWILGPEPCPICQDNADDGPIELDDVFSSGDDAPSAHPNCECALSPVVEEDDTVEELAKLRGQFACS